MHTGIILHPFINDMEIAKCLPLETDGKSKSVKELFVTSLAGASIFSGPTKTRKHLLHFDTIRFSHVQCKSWSGLWIDV